jgi:sugar O-acyltransferase (sialic acid O-acetyltransferase NeuD family)
MAKVVVFGNGQAASLNYMMLSNDSPHEVVAFTVDRAYLRGTELHGLPIVAFENIQDFYPPDFYMMSIFLSYRKLNRVRAEKYFQAKEKGYKLISYVHSRAFSFPDTAIGDNCFILDNASLGAFTVIENNVIVGSGSIIGHNSVIKTHCFIGPHVVMLGSTTIEPYCLIGANSTIKDGGIVIAKDCIIGAGTVIGHNTHEGDVYLETQAKLAPVKSNQLRTWLTWGIK